MNWSEEEIAIRNLRIFGSDGPAGALSEKPAEDAPEAVIEGECCQLLHEDGWRTLKTDPVRDRSRAKGFGELGMPDTLCLRYSRQGAACEALWLEWKSRGGRPKKHQLEWHTRERARGAMTAIAGVDFPASIKGFRSWYRASGLGRTLQRGTR
jgi:hypothetical protein